MSTEDWNNAVPQQPPPDGDEYLTRLWRALREMAQRLRVLEERVDELEDDSA